MRILQNFNTIVFYKRGCRGPLDTYRMRNKGGAAERASQPPPITGSDVMSMSLLLAFAPTVFHRVTPDYLASWRFLSCKAFSVFEVVRVACLSLTKFVLCPQSTTRQTSHVNDFVNAKSRAMLAR